MAKHWTIPKCWRRVYSLVGTFKISNTGPPGPWPSLTTFSTEIKALLVFLNINKSKNLMSRRWAVPKCWRQFYGRLLTFKIPGFMQSKADFSSILISLKRPLFRSWMTSKSTTRSWSRSAGRFGFKWRPDWPRWAPPPSPCCPPSFPISQMEQVTVFSRYFIRKPLLEVGNYVAIDLSGKNLRIMLLVLAGKGTDPRASTSNFIIPNMVMKGTGEQVILGEIYCFAGDRKVLQWRML